MKSIRVVAVGMLIGAVLMSYFAVDFARWQMSESQNYLFMLTVGAISHRMSTALNLVSVAFYMLSCLSIGLWISAVIYSKIEDTAIGIISALALRNMDSDYARELRKRYLGWLPAKCKIG